jgi:hypothetical protein
MAAAMSAHSESAAWLAAVAAQPRPALLVLGTRKSGRRTLAFAVARRLRCIPVVADDAVRRAVAERTPAGIEVRPSSV